MTKLFKLSIFIITAIMLYSCSNDNPTEPNTNKSNYRIQIQNAYTPDGTLLYYWVYNYSSGGKLLNVDTYDSTNFMFNILYYYDSNNVLYKTATISADSIYSYAEYYKYDSAGFLSESSLSYSPDTISSIAKFIFDTITSNKLKCSYYSNDNQLQSYLLFDYSNQGVRVKSWEYSAQDSLIGYTIYEYRDELLSKTSFYSATDSLVGYRTFISENKPSSFNQFTYGDW